MKSVLFNLYFYMRAGNEFTLRNRWTVACTSCHRLLRVKM
jgi:hypothetical protein